MGIVRLGGIFNGAVAASALGSAQCARTKCGFASTPPDLSLTGVELSIYRLLRDINDNRCEPKVRWQ